MSHGWNVVVLIAHGTANYYNSMETGMEFRRNRDSVSLCRTEFFGFISAFFQWTKFRFKLNEENCSKFLRESSVKRSYVCIRWLVAFRICQGDNWLSDYFLICRTALINSETTDWNLSSRGIWIEVQPMRTKIFSKMSPRVIHSPH